MQTVATFTDPGGAELSPDIASHYSVLINWGDGNTSAGVISYDMGTFTVMGSHTYAEESSADDPVTNPYDITVTISHETAPDAIVHSSGVVHDPAVVATGGQVIAAVEGASTGSVLLATFTDPGGPEGLGGYSADINWGDGTGTLVGAGSITLNGSTFEVRGTHTYADEDGTPFTITITIHHEATTPQVVTSTANVSDPAVVATGGFLVTSNEGSSTGSALVATFTDPGNPTGNLTIEASGTDYVADIDWGDGSLNQPNSGTITYNSGTQKFEVRGSHTYTDGPNDYTITVVIHHEATTDADS